MKWRRNNITSRQPIFGCYSVKMENCEIGPLLVSDFDLQSKDNVHH